MPKSAPEMISVREFARRDGCDEKLVRNAVRSGHLPKSPGKQLPAHLVGTGWRETNRRAADTRRKLATPHSAPARLSDDSERACGVADGLHYFASSVPRLVAEAAREADVPSDALMAALRTRLLSRMAELLDREAVNPILLVVDDAELARITEADSWAEYQWPGDTLDEAEAAHA